MVSGLDGLINGIGAEGWELVSAVPLVAPNRDGIAYGTVGIMAILKRALKGGAGDGGA